MSLQDRSADDPDSTTIERFQRLSISHESFEMEDIMGIEEPMTMEQRLQHARGFRVYGEKLLRDYRISKKAEDIDKSVHAYGQAVKFACEDSQQPHFKYDYSIALLERYNFQNDLIDIDMAISMLQSALDAIPDGGKEVTNWSGFLSTLNYMRFKASDDMAYLSHSIDALRTSIQTNPGDGRVPSALNNISFFLRQRFQLSDHNLADISEAISFRQRLISTTPQDNENMPSWLEVLGVYFEDRFCFSGELDDLSEAISALGKALNLSPGHDTHFIRRLGRRGILYRQRSEHGGGMNDILKSVNDHEEALRIAPDNYLDLYELLGNLGNSYLCMYEQTEDQEHISEALASLQYATQLIPKDNPDAPSFWSNLGSAYSRRFESTLDPQDISSAISAQQQSIQLASEHDSRLPSLLNNLGQSHQVRFDITGDLLDISDAISVQRKSINLTSENHVDMHKHLTNLGIALQCRAERTEDINDISEAIDVHRRAVELCRLEDSLMPIYLSNLGNSLYSRIKMDKDSKNFDEVMDSKDIDEAILLYRRALDLSRKDDTISVASHHASLCFALTKRFKLSKNIGDIDDAVHSAEIALEFCRQDRSVDLISRLNTLATALSARFKHSRNLSDITRAISAQNKAIELFPHGHPFLSAQYFNAGDSLEMLFELNNDVKDIEAATNKFKEAASLTSAPPSMRLKAAKSWAEAAKLLDPSGNSSINAYEMAISLVSQVAGIEKTIGLRHRNLLQTSSVSNEAAAAAFASKNLQYALEWLEQGRCIVWNQLHNLHTPFDNLSDYDPELANNLARVARDLDAVGLRDEGVPSGLDSAAMIEKMALQDEATKHVRLAQEWETLLAKVRGISGCEDFLQPVKYDDLVGQTPDKGYVVVINVHPDRCDAIAIRGAEKDTLHIPLSSFTCDGAVRLVRLLDSVLTSNRLRADENTLETEEETRGTRPYLGSSNPMQTILTDLWLEVADPILQALGVLRSDSGELTRVWWCPTGPLCFLPIHAAGIYNGAKNICLSDFVVSSYIPSVSTLVHSMRISRSLQRITDHPEVVIIAQEDAPGLPPLPGVKKEVEVLRQRFDSVMVKFSCLQGSTATMERTLTEMETHNFVHLACHAVQDLSHPLKSGFHLSDGRLELWTMLKIHNRNAEFAFLSACQTARGDSRLWEEVVHLGAGMLAVGYRGVVSTLWSIQDKYGMKIADQFYSRLFEREEDIHDGEGKYGSAGALHYAVKRLRAEVGDSPTGMLAWVPYVHMGV